MKFRNSDLFWFLQVYVDTLVKKAYDNWMHVIEYDGKSLLSYKENKSLDASQTEVLVNSQDYSNSFDQQFALPSLTVPVPSEQPTMNSAGLTVGGLIFFYKIKVVYITIFGGFMHYNSAVNWVKNSSSK